MVAVALVAALAAADAPAERPCTAATVEERVEGFARDLGAGRVRRANRAFAREPAFEWYATAPPGERMKAASKRRRTLRGYFARRVARGERIEMRSIRSFYEDERDIRHMHGRLWRSAEDLPRTRYIFKGAVSCSSGRIIVWLMTPEA